MRLQRRTESARLRPYNGGMTKHHIAISGAGIGGLTAALALAREGHTITLFERDPSPCGSGAGIVLAANAMANLHILGIGESLTRAGHLLREMRICTAGGRVLSQASLLTEKDGATLGSVGIRRAELHRVLLSACETERDVHLRFGEVFENIRESGHVVTVSSARGEETFDALIGADGLHSRVRAFLHGEGELRYAGYRCFRGVAEGQFSLGDVGTESWGRGQRLGLVPVGPRHVYWFAVENAKPGEHIDPEQAKKAVLARFRKFGTTPVEVVQATRAQDILVHDLADRVPLSTWGKGRITLLGDAAHPMTPNMGQGAGQAIEDAAFLAATLRDFELESDLAAALSRYERVRLPRANDFVAQSHRLGRIAQTENALGCLLRDLLVWLTPNSVAKRSLERLLAQGVAPRPLELPA